jgi:predicted 3-demethylubiquinone-9 3-methyltransferase (glyoxalase superfamily)
MTHYTGEEPSGEKGSVMTVSFELDGQEFVALNGGPRFKFTEAVSFVVNCETQEEIDYYWEKLAADGGEEVQCGWLTDKYGLSWQVVPTKIREWMQDKDPARSQRVMHAVMGMKKLDMEAMQRAYEGK